MKNPNALFALLIVACGGQSGEYPIERPVAERDFCTLTLALAQVVATACPNVYTAPPGDPEAESARERPTNEVQAYLAYSWEDAEDGFIAAADACGLELDQFSGVDSEEYGVANADECADLKECFEAEGISIPDEWPDMSYFDLLPEGEDTCGLQARE